jgi:hypothetical protein
MVSYLRNQTKISIPTKEDLDVPKMEFPTIEYNKYVTN